MNGKKTHYLFYFFSFEIISNKCMKTQYPQHLSMCLGQEGMRYVKNGEHHCEKNFMMKKNKLQKLFWACLGNQESIKGFNIHSKADNDVIRYSLGKSERVEKRCKERFHRKSSIKYSSVLYNPVKIQMNQLL